MREITGKELERALLKTQGRTWDGVPLPKLSVSDLKQDAIQLFKDKAVKRGRLTKEEVSVEDTILMDNLHLIDEDGYLIRAAMLAFYKDPEKWVTGSYIKIGYFGKSDSDLVYHPNQNGQDVNKLIIDFCKDPKSVQEIMDEFDFDSRTSFRRKYLTPMLKNGVLKMTIPEKPSSKNQKYFS